MAASTGPKFEMTNKDTAPEIVLATPHSLDLELDELTTLAMTINQELAGQLRARAAGRPHRGTATRFIDVIQLILPSADFVKDAAYTLLIERVIAFMRERFKRPHEERRPRHIEEYDTEGRLLRTFVIRDAKAETEVWQSEPPDEMTSR